MKHAISFLVVFVFITPFSNAATAGNDNESLDMIPLHDGENNIDLDGDGTKDNIFVAWRDNNNAHSYNRITFYRKAIGKDHQWEIVPFFDLRGKLEKDSQRTILGADCILRSVVLVRRIKDSSLSVIVVNRDFGRSYNDAAQITFNFYGLTRNYDGIPGWPPIYWKLEKTVKSIANYCDATEALKSELKEIVSTDK